LVQTGKTVREASAEWLAYRENVRDCTARRQAVAEAAGIGVAHLSKIEGPDWLLRVLGVVKKGWTFLTAPYVKRDIWFLMRKTGTVGSVAGAGVTSIWWP
jgi:hypothetical protein